MTKNHKGAGAVMEAERNESVSVEYPQGGEAITCPCYTMRIKGVPNASRVEISIDGGEWSACRESLGLWWYDWKGYGSGEHVAAVRAQADGKTVESPEPRKFEVNLSS